MFVCQRQRERQTERETSVQGHRSKEQENVREDVRETVIVTLYLWKCETDLENFLGICVSEASILGEQLLIKAGGARTTQALTILKRY